MSSSSNFQHTEDSSKALYRVCGTGPLRRCQRSKHPRCKHQSPKLTPLMKARSTPDRMPSARMVSRISRKCPPTPSRCTLELSRDARSGSIWSPALRCKIAPKLEQRLRRRPELYNNQTVTGYREIPAQRFRFNGGPRVHTIGSSVAGATTDRYWEIDP